MKLICLNDAHLTCINPINRLDSIELAWKKKLRFVFDYAVKNDISYVVHGGDFFDKSKDWQTLTTTINFLKQINKRVDIFSVFGQHDTHLYSEKTRDRTCLGILNAIEFVEVLGIKHLDYKTTLQGCSYGQKIPEPIKGKFNILSIHKMISDRPLWLDHEYTDAKKFLKENEFDLVVCGDAHIQFVEECKGRFIVNSGPLLRLEASKDMLVHRPGFWVFDTDNPKNIFLQEIPHEPAEKVLSRISIENKNKVNHMLTSFIESVKTKEVEHFSYSDNLNTFIKDNAIEQEVVDKISKEMENES